MLKCQSANGDESNLLNDFCSLFGSRWVANPTATWLRVFSMRSDESDEHSARLTINLYKLARCITVAKAFGFSNTASAVKVETTQILILHLIKCQILHRRNYANCGNTFSGNNFASQMISANNTLFVQRIEVAKSETTDKPYQGCC